MKYVYQDHLLVFVLFDYYVDQSILNMVNKEINYRVNDLFDYLLNINTNIKENEIFLLLKLINLLVMKEILIIIKEIEEYFFLINQDN
jgi:hypothetical protein